MRECWAPFVQHHCEMLIQCAHWPRFSLNHVIGLHEKNLCVCACGCINTTQRWLLLIQLKTHRDFQWINYYSVLCVDILYTLQIQLIVIITQIFLSCSHTHKRANIFPTIFDFPCNNYYISTSIFNQVKQRCGKCGVVLDFAIWFVYALSAKCRPKCKSHRNWINGRRYGWCNLFVRIWNFNNDIDLLSIRYVLANVSVWSYTVCIFSQYHSFIPFPLKRCIYSFDHCQ